MISSYVFGGGAPRSCSRIAGVRSSCSVGVGSNRSESRWSRVVSSWQHLSSDNLTVESDMTNDVEFSGTNAGLIVCCDESAQRQPRWADKG